jgi:hypothetical protein
VEQGITHAPRYRLKSPHVVAQVIEGEAVLISFETGTYYSAAGMGGFIVEAIRKGAEVRAIVDGLTKSAPDARNEVERDVRVFLSELAEQGLIEPAGPEDMSDAESLEAFAGKLGAPLLEKYSDLEDLLLLDPIHDVAAAGWPVAKAPP